MTEQAKTPSGANAPYKIQRRDGEWVVVNNTGDVKAKFGQDRDKAVRYLRALYVNVPGAPKRADKVKFTGKSKDRVAAAAPTPHPFVKASGNVHQAPPLKKDTGNGGLTNQVLDTTNPDCLVCGMKEDNPIHRPTEDETAFAVDDIKIPTLAQVRASLSQISREAMLEGLDLEVAQHTGVMVALFPPADLASDLALDTEEAEPVDDLHITLAYLGKSDQLSPEEIDRLKSVVEGWAHTLPPIEARISGVGIFNNPGGEGGDDVTYASIDAPALPEARQRLIESLKAAGFPVAENHGFTPHMTLAYAKVPVVLESRPVVFSTATVAIGDERQSFTFSANAESETDNAEAAAEPITMSDGKYPISDQKSANSAWKLRNHSDAHSESEVVAHIRRACTKLGLKFPGDDSEKAVAVKTRRGKHRFVSKAHVKSSVYRGAGWQGGACIACGKPGNDPDHDGDVDDLSGNDVDATTAVAEDDDDAGKMVQGLDAAIDQALVLLRSVSDDDLAPYAAQARDLLQGVEETCDALLEYFGVSDADDEPDSQDEALAQATAEQATGVAAHAAYLAQAAKAFAVVRSRRQRVDPVPPETVKAFLTEVNGKTLLTAPASTADLGLWEKALTPNEHMLWIQGRFVGADEPNRNGAFWSSEDLENGAATVPFGPLNWLHDGRHIIGTIADQRMVYPDEQAAEQGLRPHIAAVSAMYRWIYPEEAAVIEMAAEQQKLWYSMECISRDVSCVGANGCGQQVSYMAYLQGKGCDHMTQRSADRRFIDPTFLGGAVIVPPARPGWADANATLMRQAASYAEQAYEQMGSPDLPAFEVERLLAQVLQFANVAA